MCGFFELQNQIGGVVVAAVRSLYQSIRCMRDAERCVVASQIHFRNGQNVFPLQEGLFSGTLL